MSKRTLVLQSAGGLLGLACLNLALAPAASANSTNMSNGTGACVALCGNMSHATGGNMSNGTGGNMSNGTGGNMSNGSGACAKPGDCSTNISNGSGIGNGSNTTGAGECKTSPCPPGTKPKDPFVNISTGSGSSPTGGGSYVIGKNNFSQFNAGGKGGSNYGASSTGLSKQIMELLNAAASDYADKSARLAAIESQTAPAKKDDSVRYSRVADANADCGCNASAAAPDNSVELAAARKAQVEAAESLAKAQQQAREFLEAQKKAGIDIAGTQFSPIW
jgi:hypothetical protein